MEERNQPEARGGGFAGALERAGRSGRPGPASGGGGDGGGEATPAGGTVDALLAGNASPGRAEALAQASGAPLLARAVERIVLMVKSGEAAAVTMQMGPSLDVRIEQGRAGVEVRIRAAHGLSPMAEAELPLLVAALRARGVRVARAGVERRGREGRPSLTPRRSSATTAAGSGTVAKW